MKGNVLINVTLPMVTEVTMMAIVVMVPVENVAVAGMMVLLILEKLGTDR